LIVVCTSLAACGGGSTADRTTTTTFAPRQYERVHAGCRTFLSAASVTGDRHTQRLLDGLTLLAKAGADEPDSSGRVLELILEGFSNPRPLREWCLEQFPDLG
jgi:hypothetical protein